jgi:hypothetical protein
MATMMRVLLGDDKFSAFTAIDDCAVLINRKNKILAVFLRLFLLVRYPPPNPKDVFALKPFGYFISSSKIKEVLWQRKI